MWLYSFSLLFVLFVVWLIHFTFTPNVDVPVVVLLSHWICSILFLLNVMFHAVTVEVFSCSFESLIITQFIVILIKKTLNILKVDKSAVIMEILVNLDRLFRWALIMRSLITVTDHILIWPVIKHYGWTGDFRGILLFAIPLYTIIFVSQNQDLAKIPVISFIISLTIHFILHSTGLSHGVQTHLGIWIMIILANIISFFWSTKKPIKTIKNIQNDFNTFVTFMKR